MYTPFENLKISTITAVVHVEGEINYKRLFELLPIDNNILAIRYESLKRGFKESNGFKNCTTIDLDDHGKIVDMKISRNKIHICGAKSMQAINTYANTILRYINDIEKKLRKEGDSILSVYPLTIKKIDKSMINYNYNIGFKINRLKLYEILTNNGFICKYNNSINHLFCARLPYKCDNIKRKKMYHSFMIYRSGSITQSGPDENMMKEAYDKFMNLVINNKDVLRSYEK